MREHLRQVRDVRSVAGTRAAVIRAMKVVVRRLRPPDLVFGMRRADVLGALEVLDADTRAETGAPAATTADDLRLASIEFIVPAIWPGSGGHRDIFRMVDAATARGVCCSVALYDPAGTQSLHEFRRIVRRHFTAVDVHLRIYDEPNPDVDGTVATSWHTAYPAAAHSRSFPAAYFVQDYEPLFYPVGSEQLLAELTYSLGLPAITLGTWLEQKLTGSHETRCRSIEFEVDTEIYRFDADARREGVSFYARPVTPRRAYEIGILALREFHRRMPTTPIHLYGWPIDPTILPFPATSHGILNDSQLNDLHNSTEAALVMSLTNLSLLPMELLACGCIPVLTHGPNNEQNLQDRYAVYCEPNPIELANGLIDAVEAAREGRIDRQQLAASVSGASWDDAGARFLDNLSALLGPRLAV